MITTMTWLIRYGHVVSGATWVGGYMLLALVIVPRMTKDTHASLIGLAISTVRLLTYAGTLTIGFGIVLITRTRGVANLWGTEWGTLVLICLVIAVALLGIGDGALRPALHQLGTTGDGRAARRYARLGLGLTVLAVALMTRTLYARN